MNSLKVLIHAQHLNLTVLETGTLVIGNKFTVLIALSYMLFWEIFLLLQVFAKKSFKNFVFITHALINSGSFLKASLRH